MIHMNRRQALASAAGVTALAALPAGCNRRPAAAIGAWGIDLTARDTSVSPGDDFFRYVNGAWLDSQDIPSDRTSWGTFNILIEKAERDVRGVIEGTLSNRGADGSNSQKIADYYSAYLDTDAINTAGLGPARPDLDRIAALQTIEDVVRFAGAPGAPVGAPFGLGVTVDERNPDRYVTTLGHGGLSLPDRDYYLDNSEAMQSTRTAFVAHMGRMLTLANYPDAEGAARAVMALETEIARRHWPIAQRRQRELTYNLRTRDQIRALSRAFPWDAHFEAGEMSGVNDVVVQELSSIGPLAQLWMATPVSTWRAYLTYHYLSNTASVLPSSFDDENFAFYGSTLSGQPAQLDRWRRAVNATNGALGKAVGELYVAQHFPPEAKAQMLDLVENMRRAYGERIDQLTWMSAETKVAAREKLATFNPKIGYPDNPRDYSAFEVRAGDAFGNARRQAAYYWRYDVARLGRPTDKTEWLYMDPQDVNAYYNDTFNEIVFPAAILQPPFFDPNADAAVNYGAIGGVIGHEMGHGFDDQGAKSDAHGVLRDWWNAEDVRRFGELTSALSAQYAQFEALPGLHLNGDLTLGENIGDNGGLQVAHYAYQLSLNGEAAPELDGTTGDQRFFMSWAQAWRMKMRDGRCGSSSFPIRTRRRNSAATAPCATWTLGMLHSMCSRATRSTFPKTNASKSGDAFAARCVPTQARGAHLKAIAAVRSSTQAASQREISRTARRRTNAPTSGDKSVIPAGCVHQRPSSPVQRPPASGTPRGPVGVAEPRELRTRLAQLASSASMPYTSASAARIMVDATVIVRLCAPS
ncbi:MAG: M13 family metallopeptidase [Hyphomonadaceae bacterium]